jgi:serine/threonine-protein kinase
MPWPEEIPGAVMAGRYRLLRALDGERRRLYEARHDRLAGRFAVKLYPDAEPSAFRRRAQLALALRHPGAAQVIDYGPDASAAPGVGAGGQAFVVMEWIDGVPLSAFLRESGILPLDLVVRVVGGVAQALAAAHAQQIVHGDLSPDRILLLTGDGGGAGGEPPTTKVIGFGLGWGVSRAPELKEVTPYTAPEQLAADADERSDLFALGAVAYEMLAGVPPFDDGDADGDGGDRHEAPSIRDYVPDVNVIADDVIRRALALDPARRWPDVKTFADRLREAGLAGGADERTRIAITMFADPGADPNADALDALTPPPPLVSPSEKPTARALLPIPGVEIDVDVDEPLPPRRGFPPPAAGARPFDLAPRGIPATAGVPWAPPVPTMTIPAPRSGRGALRLVALLATAGLVAFAGVKMNLWQVAQEMLGRVTDGKPSSPGATPVTVPAPAPVAAPATAPTPPAAAPAAGAPAQPPPPAVADGAPKQQPAERGAQRAVRPEVVPLPAAQPSGAPAAPAVRHRSHHHHRGAAELSPELAAEEALLGGGDATPAPKAAGKRRARSAAPSDTEATGD